MKLESLRGDWALITGASSGIGQAFAERLAALGMNCVLVARREDRLRALAERLQATHGNVCIAFPADLAAEGTASRVRARLVGQDIHIRLLCNSAASGRWGYVDDVEVSAYAEMIRLNANAMVESCVTFLPDLTTHVDSVIINISSQAAYQPVPYMAVYAATKAFVHGFSLALHEEWRDRGLYVQTLVPGPTATEFDDVAGAYRSQISRRDPPSAVVDASMRSLGKREPLSTSVPRLWPQRLFAAMFPPAIVLDKVAGMFRPPPRESAARPRPRRAEETDH